MEISKMTAKKICGIIVFAGAVFFLIWNYQAVGRALSFVWGILLPFVIGAVIAFIVNVPMRSIERKLFKDQQGKGYARILSMIITLLLVAAVITGVVLIVIPRLGETIKQLIKSANDFLPKFKVYADDLLSDNSPLKAQIDSFDIDMSKVTSTITDFVKNGAGSAVTGAFSAAKTVISVITTAAIGFVFSCYLLTQKEQLARQATMLTDAIFPEKVGEKIKYIAKKCSDTFSSFISCQCLEACILGLMFLVVLLITRMPYALLISVLIAFMALIPLVGAFIGCAVGAFLILMESPVKALIFIAIFLVLQWIEGNLIYPRVVGGSVGLPSMWVLLAITAGSSLMGVAGMLFFIPLASVIYSLIREWTYERLEKKQCLESANEEAPPG